jgi:AraC-like DNA-binding protein
MDDGKSPRGDLSFEERALRQANLTESCASDPAFSERMSGNAVSGVMRWFTVRHGFSVSCFDVESTGRFDGSARSEPSLVLAALLNCAGRGFATTELSALPLEVPYTPNTLIYCFTRVATRGDYDVPPTRFRGVEVRLSHSYLDQLLALDLFREATSTHPFHLASNAGLWVGTAPLTNAQQASAERILRSAAATPSDDLAVETSGLALLDSALAAMRAASAADFSEVAENRFRLEAARALIMRDVAHGWSIAEIADAVGLTEKRLKTGFRAKFGMPVYAYLQNARLTLARQLLDAGNQTVTEVSLAVGYANPSHFAFLYKRAFGNAPSARINARR